MVTADKMYEEENTTKCNFSSTVRESFLNEEEKVSLIVILLLVALIGFFANGLVAYTICRSFTTYIDVPGNIFILSQVFADLASSSSIPIYIYHILAWNWKLVYIYTTFTWIASLGSLFLLTFNRLISIYDPLKYPSRMTPFRAKILAALIWSAALVISLLHMIGYVIHSDSNFFNYGRYYIMLLIVLVILSHAYMYRESRKQARKIKKHAPQLTGIQRNLKDDFKSVRTLALVGGTFLVSCCPLTIIIFLYGNEKESVRFQRYVAYLVPFAMLNPIFDPVIYYFRSAGLRGKFYQRFKRLGNLRGNVRNYKVPASFILAHKKKVTITDVNLHK